MFCFANFLLGRDIYGPGKYIFGVFDNREMSETFKVKYNENDEMFEWKNNPIPSFIYLLQILLTLYDTVYQGRINKYCITTS